ncbi:MAG: mechanosensitive ion channel family protein, partial [Nanoarchaeota archaeon]
MIDILNMLGINVTRYDASLALEYFGNSLHNYVNAFLLFAILVLIMKIFKMYVLLILKKAAKRTKTNYDDWAFDFIDQVKWPFFVYLSFFIATRGLVFPTLLDRIMYILLIVQIVFYVIRGLGKITDHIIQERVKEKDAADEGSAMVVVMGKIIKVIMWVIAFLFVLINFGVNITPLIAGIGVGGIAIAFALQNILEDLFSSFTIFFDKPFKKGDFIVIGTDMGTVKDIGMKTTRIQTLQGQELVVSNRELTSTRINNYKKMEKRRVVFKIGVEYGTSVAKLKQAKKVIGEIIKKEKFADLDRCHFSQFADFSLVFETVYFIKSTDYNVYMDTQERINL